MIRIMQSKSYMFGWYESITRLNTQNREPDQAQEWRNGTDKRGEITKTITALADGHFLSIFVLK